jgi:hypothetical protein
MAKNHGPCDEPADDNLCRHLGLNATCKNENYKRNNGHYFIFGHYRQRVIYDGLLCIQAQRLTSKNIYYYLQAFSWSHHCR